MVFIESENLNVVFIESPNEFLEPQGGDRARVGGTKVRSNYEHLRE